MRASFRSSTCNAFDTAGSESAEAHAAGFCARAVPRDGTAVCVRAIRPDDKVRMRIAFERLSPQTVYRGLFQHLSGLTTIALREAAEQDFRRAAFGPDLSSSAGAVVERNPDRIPIECRRFADDSAGARF